LEAAGAKPSQSIITEYFSVLDKLSQILNENQKLIHILQLTKNNAASSPTIHVTPLLHHLMKNADQNTGKLDKQRRHSAVLKKFATLLYIFSGSMAYEFIQKNMAEALPSLTTVKNIMHRQYSKIEEGIFRFDDLLVHLKKYNSPFLVAIAEDATRIVQRVEYDAETNHCIGFVLPIDGHGLPQTDTFVADTFEDIEQMFTNHPIAKYSYLYTATPLKEHVPSFTLACVGSDNKFTHEQVLQRWQYIFRELSNRGIRVISFAADGDSRLLKAMRIMYGFSVDPLHLRPTKSMPALLCENINKWLCVKLLPLLCVQDVVHLGVKLKARLLKPSIILPLGSFTASSAHLQILMGLHGKDVHGLRHRDIDHRDRQNFDAVEHIIAASSLLDNIPDALGTKLYLNLIQSSIHSFLDKQMSPLQRLEEMWYSVFFIRYWRQWILLHPQFTLQDNFITGNAYMCIEINAHSLLALILIMRDMSHDSTYFNPWLLGSQSCERTFRLLRSMTGNFSTIVNFSMQGFLQRVHKLAVKDDLESDEERMANEIKIPRMEKHINKDGIGKHQTYSMNLSDEVITDTLLQAETRAKNNIETLGMADELRKNKMWDTPPLPLSLHNLVVEDDDRENEDEDNEADEKLVKTEDSFVSSNETISEIIADVDNLHENEIVDDTVREQVRKLKTSLLFAKDEESKFPVYVKKDDNHTEDYKTVSHSPFVEVKLGERNVYIRKTTAIWLFQDTERVSSDRIFRVRATQPGKSVDKVIETPKENSNVPVIAKHIVTGDVCVFDAHHHWRIGRVLQFIKYDRSGSKPVPHNGNYGNTEDRMGVLCTWYECCKSERQYILSANSTTKHEYYPMSNYICTLTNGCFDNNDNHQISDTPKCTSLIPLNNEFMISQCCLNKIQEIVKDRVIDSLPPTPPDTLRKQSKTWISIDKLILTEKERLALTNGQQLSDIHITAAQRLLQKQFSHLNGLQSTTYQLSKPLSDYRNVLQILHVTNPEKKNQTIDHWSVLSTMNCENSPFNSNEVITQLLTASNKCFNITVNIISIGKQSGSTECGLYAIAIATSLANNIDPVTILFRQEEMRAHYVQCLEQGKLEPFPVAKARRSPKNPVIEKLQIYSCPTCYRGDDGSSMVQCDGCDLWYHAACVESFNSEETWYGSCCQKAGK
jgi:hypothetical protein